MFIASTTSMKSLVSESGSDRDRNSGYTDTQPLREQRRDIEDDRSKTLSMSLSSRTNPSKKKMKKHSSLIIRIVPQDLRILNEMACWRVFSCGNLKSEDFTADTTDDSVLDSQDECGFEIGEDGYEISEQGSLLQQNYGMSRV
jgi:hypothetical protein